MRFIILFFVYFPFLSLAQDGGIYLGKTRVIFTSKSESESLSVANSSNSDIWLIRSWISNQESTKTDNKKSPFIITPPLYRLDPHGSINLKINKLPGDFPNNKESLFYVNVMAIPPIKYAGDKSGGTIQFSLNNRIKMFYRPSEISSDKEVFDAYKQLTATKATGVIIINNPTPYFITLTQVKINGVEPKQNSGFMVSPFSDQSVSYKGSSGKISFKTINDFGGLTNERTLIF